MESDDLNFLKLSHPKHKTIPTVIDSLKLAVNEIYGRHIITSENLKTGDVIAIVKPFYKSLDKNEDLSRCVYCFKSAKSGITCSSCASVKFCSAECQRFALDEFHGFECKSMGAMTSEDGFLMMIERSLFKAIKVCGSVKELRTLIVAQRSSLTVFDIDFKSDDLDKLLLLACYSLEDASPTPRELVLVDQLINHHASIKTFWRTDDERSFLKKFIIKFIGIMYRNSFTLHWRTEISDKEDIGCAIIPFASLFNHSCSPNVYRFCVNDDVVFIAKRPIKANEQIFISYQHQFHQSRKNERQRSLQRQFNFICTCDACLNDYPLTVNLKTFDKDFSCSEKFMSLEEAKQIFVKNCEYIEKHFDKFPCFELTRLMQINYKSIQFIMWNITN